MSIGVKLTALGGVLGVVLGGCGGLTVEEGTTSKTSVGLVRVQSCEELSQAIIDDGVAQVKAKAKGFRDTIDSVDWNGGGWGGNGGGAIDNGGWGTGGSSVGGGEDPSFGSGGSGNGGTGSSAPSPNEGAGARGNVGDGESAGGPDGHSETNTQVAGIDEADIVKTDGERLWLLQAGNLMALDVWPPQSLAIEKSLPIEGSPREMFVADGKAVVYSDVYVETDAPEGGEGKDGWGAETGGGAAPPRPEPGIGGNGGTGGFGDSTDVMPEPWPEEPPVYYKSLLKITVVDLKGDDYIVEKELYLDGSYSSARRYGEVVRTVVTSEGQFLPQEFYYTYADSFLYEYYGMPLAPLVKEQIKSKITAWENRLVDQVRGMNVDSVLPRNYAPGADDSLVPLDRNCNEYYVPAAGGSDGGILRVVGLSLSDLGKVQEAGVLGRSDEVYSSAENLVLSSTRYGQWGGETILHNFRLNNAATQYLASGLVQGTIKDQFSIDATSEGIIRVAVTGQDSQFNSANHVYALRANGAELEVIGDTGPMALGEQIFSARFVGERGYIVTFRQTDPLFVIDLKDPNQLKVLGELKIPGFSDYMHPLDKDHLVTIGRHRADDGFSEDALALQIFDVSEPTKPALDHKYVFSQDAWSEANYEHKAFSFYPEKNLMAFPMSGYSWDEMSGYGQPRSSLEVFHVTAKDGFKKLGSADHTVFNHCNNEVPEGGGYCEYYYENSVRRGVFIDKYVYSVGTAGILVHEVADMSDEVARLPFGN